jgi:hypothetical protein
MRKSIAAAVVAASAATASCGQARSEGAGPTVSRNFQVGNFQQIEVAGPYDVTVRTGSNPSVSAQGSQKLLDQTIVEVRGDKLIIHPEAQRHFFQWGFGNRGKADFTVTVPQLNGAAIAGSGDIHVDNVKGDRFDGNVGGSGGLDVSSVEVGSLKLSIGGSGSVKAAGGKAETAEYSIGGSGDIDASAVQTQQARVSIAGSGSVRAHATGTADVRIMGAGDVDVTGGAKCTVSKTGSGDVRCS